MKDIRKVALATLFIFSAVMLTACGGGGGGGAPAPTNAVVNKGVIEKFGSIFVNGIEFKTAGAKLHLRDTKEDKDLAAETEVKDFLKAGMVVTVKGLVDDSGKTGIAQEVEFRNTLKAKIDDKG